MGVGYRYPHSEAEFLVAIGLTVVAAGILIKLAERLPSWVGVPLAILPLLALVTLCIVFWYRTRR